jgi:hypothetical protein
MSLGVIIPVKNEYGNIKAMVIATRRVSQFNQIVFIDGNSTDHSFELLIECINKFGDSRMSAIIQQPPYNKFEGVKQAKNHLTSDHIMIWDGDNTIPFEDVQEMIKLYLNQSKEKNLFLTANRLTQSRERNSFRFFNLLGNYLFSILMQPILREPVMDVLSGIKIFPTYIFENSCQKSISLDQFGDISLFSFARKNNLNLVSVPCNYRVRTYGNSNIARWNGGLIMLRLIFHLYLHRCFK